MPICQKCNRFFPFIVEIGGRKRNLSSRKYCLDCSPFGKHNTKKLETWSEPTECDSCGSRTNKRQGGRNTCYACLNRIREERKLGKLSRIVGDKCWKCNYGNSIRILDFHHMRNKKFGLTTRNIGQRSWTKVWEEVRKCLLLCCRCHREINFGIFTKVEATQLYKTKWQEILAYRSTG